MMRAQSKLRPMLVMRSCILARPRPKTRLWCTSASALRATEALSAYDPSVRRPHSGRHGQDLARLLDVAAETNAAWMALLAAWDD